MAQLALQGPKAEAVFAKVCDQEPPAGYYTFIPEMTVAGVKCLVSRTGYTGEDGFELYCANADAGALVARHVIGDLTGEYLQSVGNELVQGGNTQAGEYGGGLGAALLTGDQHLGAGLSLGVGQHAVFLDDQGAAQGDHHQHAQQAAAQAQTTVTDAAKKAYEEATAALDAYVRAQSRRYTTAELRLTSLDFRCPLDSYGRITTQFGEADPWGIPHRGTDFAAPGGTPIYAIADGIVSAARAMNSYGNCVQVSHGTADDGCRYDSLYAHMSSIAVAEGTAVRRGDLLGYVGNTGNVYGAGGGYHLHLELRVNGSRTDPLGYVPSR